MRRTPLFGAFDHVVFLPGLLPLRRLNIVHEEGLLAAAGGDIFGDVVGHAHLLHEVHNAIIHNHGSDVAAIVEAKGALYSCTGGGLRWCGVGEERERTRDRKAVAAV